MRSMVGSASKPLTRDELKLLADAMVAAHASILMRYDGALIEKDTGAAHLAASQAKALLAEYRKIKERGGR